ncbi:hypothetical protein [Macrococcoides caseolyticum]|uniref:hypothetical protein n=1 Tax=Macrococcoides caseolyticum TaxID=69966 RepID=UPI001F40ED88|nr:hypothetical protein [Macrococcus caseolyticus]MCE4957322.1 hypothetical protein [Macrococcus caseolyticus]
MNTTLPLLDINNRLSLVYKRLEVHEDPKTVIFKIALIQNDSNLQFTHAIFEDELEVLNELLLLKTGEYHFSEPDIFIAINQIYENTIDISFHVDLALINNLPSDDQYETYDMTIEKSAFLKFVDYLIFSIK